VCPTLPLADKHTIFVPHQEMFLEMGALREGHGIVRSPIVLLSNGEVEVDAMYAKLGLVHGFPRKIVWEQTAQINPGCDKNPHLSHHRTSSTLLPALGAPCSITGDDEDAGCNPIIGNKENPAPLLGPAGKPIPETQGFWPATECGFSTLLGSYNDGKFNGMVWPPDTDKDKFPQAKNTDCSQDMCGIAAHDAKTNLYPLHIYISWTGTDVDDRDMSSAGLSYQSFHAFSAKGATANLMSQAKDLKKSGKECLTNHHC
jgi:hypothetical protein